MRYIYQHAQRILDEYKGQVPLTHFLRQYFRGHNKLGSRDRKILSEMVYCYYRCAKSVSGTDGIEQLLQVCLFLCATENVHAIKLLPEDWKENKSISLDEKVALLQSMGIAVNINALIDYTGEISDSLQRDEWLASLLQQPSLFIRLRGENKRIEKILAEQEIEYNIEGKCMRLPNGAPIDKLLPPDTYAVQDASSQATGGFLTPIAKQHWWDCCSGAGGKSLMLKDMEAGVRLTVSDKRNTILHNLKERFALYGHKIENAFVLDMSNPDAIAQQMGSRLFDNIICDVPCTGSGTWARTPEQAYFFDDAVMQTLPQLQKTIAVNAARYLKPGGALYYITCSVFKQENENVVAEILKQDDKLQVEELELLNGIGNKADCLFIAKIRKGNS